MVQMNLVFRTVSLKSMTSHLISSYICVKWIIHGFIFTDNPASTSRPSRRGQTSFSPPLQGIQRQSWACVSLIKILKNVRRVDEKTVAMLWSLRRERDKIKEFISEISFLEIETVFLLGIAKASLDSNLFDFIVRGKKKLEQEQRKKM